MNKNNGSQGKANKLQEVSGYIDQLLAKKNADIDKAVQLKSGAEAKKAEADKAMKAAMEKLDLEAYNAAKVEKVKAETAIELYEGRISQIRQRGYVTEEESDRIIDSLIAYQRDRNKELMEAVFKQIPEIKKLLEEYAAEYDKAVYTVNLWTQNIHANYWTTGTGPDGSPIRSQSAVPVTGITGKFPGRPEEVLLLNEFLERLHQLDLRRRS